MADNGYTRVSGTWQPFKQVHGKVSGTWQNLRECHTKVGGVWQRVWPSVTLGSSLSTTGLQSSAHAGSSRGAIFFNFNNPQPDGNDWLIEGNWGTVHTAPGGINVALKNDTATTPWIWPYLNYNLYEARATITSQVGGGTLVGTFGTWQSLDVFREWGIDVNSAGSDATLTFTFEIRDATYQNIIHTMTITCEAELI
jgi:hypothetical protein